MLALHAAKVWPVSCPILWHRVDCTQSVRMFTAGTAHYLTGRIGTFVCLCAFSNNRAFLQWKDTEWTCLSWPTLVVLQCCTPHSACCPGVMARCTCTGTLPGVTGLARKFPLGSCSLGVWHGEGMCPSKHWRAVHSTSTHISWMHQLTVIRFCPSQLQAVFD